MDRARRRQGDPDLLQARMLAGELSRRHPDAAELALLLPVEGPPIYARARAPAHPHAPESAVTRLIQGVWENHPERARTLLRRRLYRFADAAPRELDHGMLDVAAKRMSALLPGERREDGPAASRAGGPEAPAREIDFRPSPPDDALTELAARRIALGESPRELALTLRESLPSPAGPRAQADRRVVAMALGPDGTLLGAAANRNGRNRTLHAELNLVQGWWARHRRPLPPGTRIHVTLQCCRMCAAALWQVSADPSSLRVHYAERDPGPLARETVLQPRTHARRRAAAGRPDWLGLHLEWGPDDTAS